MKKRKKSPAKKTSMSIEKLAALLLQEIGDMGDKITIETLIVKFNVKMLKSDVSRLNRNLQQLQSDIHSLQFEVRQIHSREILR